MKSVHVDSFMSICFVKCIYCFYVTLQPYLHLLLFKSSFSFIANDIHVQKDILLSFFP